MARDRRYLLLPIIYLGLVGIAALLSHNFSHVADGIADNAFVTLVMPWAILLVPFAYSQGGSVLGTLVMASGAIPNAAVLGVISFWWIRRRGTGKAKAE